MLSTILKLAVASLLILLAAVILTRQGLFSCEQRRSILWDDKSHVRFQIGGIQNALLVIAHPDDECMFFTPTISVLRELGVVVYVLCLSSGNADGLGSRRREELKRSCASMGIESPVIVDNTLLQDGMHSRWPAEQVAREIENAIKILQVDIGAIITFDEHGVSRHPNHCDTSTGVRLWYSQQAGQGMFTPRLFFLHSAPIPVKYSGPISLWLPIPKVRGLYLATPKEQCSGLAYQAMLQHSSQFVWFRRLFVTFSSYMHLNYLKEDI